MEKRLYRSRTNRVIAGVCGGLAEYFNIDPTLIRIIFVVLAFANGIGILAYIILAIVVPLEGSKTTEPRDTIRENAEEMKVTARQLGQEVRSTFTGEPSSTGQDGTYRRRGIFIGILLIVLGAIFLLGTFNFFWWFRWDYLWPLVIVAIGLIIILTAWRR